MGDRSAIAWTDATWNPVTGCSKVSPGCAHCYAETLALTRMRGRPGYPGLPWTPENAEQNVVLRPERLDHPLRWRRPRRIFVNSLSDVWHPLVPDDFIDRVFAVMALAPQHQFQVLTKRPERMRAYLSATVEYKPFSRMPRVASMLMDTLGEKAVGMAWPLPNVWLGTSVENARWRSRIDELRQTPAAVRFLSCEPLLGPLTGPREAAHVIGNTVILLDDLPVNAEGLDLTGIDWVIVGGESGPGAREMKEEWARDIIAACRRQGAAPFQKQMGSVWSQEHLGHPGHAAKPEEWPEDLRVQEYPA